MDLDSFLPLFYYKHSNHFYKFYEAGTDNNACRLNGENGNSWEGGGNRNLLGLVSFKDEYVMFKKYSLWVL